MTIGMTKQRAFTERVDNLPTEPGINNDFRAIQHWPSREENDAGKSSTASEGLRMAEVRSDLCCIKMSEDGRVSHQVIDLPLLSTKILM